MVDPARKGRKGTRAKGQSVSRLLGLDVTRDPPTVSPEWTILAAPSIDGVVLKEIKPVITADGCLTEMWRRDWAVDVRGQGIDASHHVAEEAPGPLAEALASFFRP